MGPPAVDGRRGGRQRHGRLGRDSHGEPTLRVAVAPLKGLILGDAKTNGPAGTSSWVVGRQNHSLTEAEGSVDQSRGDIVVVDRGPCRFVLQKLDLRGL